MEGCYGKYYIILIYEIKEDATLCIPKFKSNSALFGVFDGHGGSLISKFAAANFEEIFKGCLDSNEEYGKEHQIENSLIQTFVKIDEMLGKQEVNEFLKSISNNFSNNYYDFNLNFSHNSKLKNRNSNANNSESSSLGSMSSNNSSLSSNNVSDNQSTNITKIGEDAGKLEKSQKPQMKKFASMLKKKELVAKHMGTTANIVFMDQNNLYVANVGDSFAVMYKDKKAIKLNTEHKTSILSEEERIYHAGAKIINDRIEGKLNLTRALGKL